MPSQHFDLLQDLLILFGLATLISVALQKLRQSTIVAYLLTGMLVGPTGLRLITSRPAIELMAEIGVVLLLFTIGIEFSLKRLLRMRQVVLSAGGRQVVGSVVLGGGVTLLLGYSLRVSLFWGFLVAASSTAIVLKLLFDRRELESSHGRIILGVLLFQDLCVVPLMALTPALTAATARLALSVVFALAKSLALVSIILLLARYLFPRLWGAIVQLRNKEIFLIATIFFSLGTAWVTSQLGLSLAIGAFLAGLVLSESEYAHQILSDILPFRDSFTSLFFISVGMLIDLSFVRQNWVLVAMAAGVIVLIKFFTAAGATAVLGFPLRMSILVGLALAQVGEFSFILLKQGADLNLVSEVGYQTFLAAAVITMLLTPLLIQVSPRLAMRLSEASQLGRFFAFPQEPELEKETTSLRDHVVVCGYGLNGRTLAVLLRQNRIPYLVVDTNPETVREARKQGEHIHFGDASKYEILHNAGGEQARAIVYAISDLFVLARAVSTARLLNPAVMVIARTKRVEDAPSLQAAGASQVISEEMEAAEEIVVRTLNLYGVSRHQAFEQLQKLRASQELAEIEG